MAVACGDRGRTLGEKVVGTMGARTKNDKKKTQSENMTVRERSHFKGKNGLDTPVSVFCTFML